MTERHKPKPHRFDVTVTDPRRTGHKARARCGCGWSGEVLRPLADARAEWDLHVREMRRNTSSQERRHE